MSQLGKSVIGTDTEKHQIGAQQQQELTRERWLDALFDPLLARYQSQISRLLLSSWYGTVPRMPVPSQEQETTIVVQS